MRKPYPCKDCTDRHLSCHSECDKYLEAKEANLVSVSEGDKATLEYESLKKMSALRKKQKRRKNYGGL